MLSPGSKAKAIFWADPLGDGCAPKPEGAQKSKSDVSLEPSQAADLIQRFRKLATRPLDLSV